MDKEDVIIHTHTHTHTHTRILSSHKKEGDLAICDNTNDLEIIILSEVSQKKTNSVWFHLYMKSKKQNKQIKPNKIINTESKLVVAREEVVWGIWTK